MKQNINNMVKGWFVGDFEPTAFKTDKAEVALKKYKKGLYEEKHYHKIATEITLISKGKVKMNGIEYIEGDIVVLPPGEINEFNALEDSELVVVKIPGEKDDKYPV